MDRSPRTRAKFTQTHQLIERYLAAKRALEAAKRRYNRAGSLLAYKVANRNMTDMNHARALQMIPIIHKQFTVNRVLRTKGLTPNVRNYMYQYLG